MGNQEEKLIAEKFLKDLGEIVKNAPDGVSFFIAVKLNAIDENRDSNGIMAVKGNTEGLTNIFANAIDSITNILMPIRMAILLSKKHNETSIIDEIFRK